jgi:hypothetical protein
MGNDVLREDQIFAVNNVENDETDDPEIEQNSGQDLECLLV